MNCAHEGAVPVESVVTREVLAALCPACDAQLPATFLADRRAATVAQLVAAGFDPDSARQAVESRDPTLLIHSAFARPQAVVTFGRDMDAEDLATFKARFLEARAEPYRVLYLPTIASQSAPTRGEIEGGP